MQQPLNEQQLHRVNEYIETILRREKRNSPIHWGTVLHILETYAMHFPRIEERVIRAVKPMTKDEIVSTALSFYNSLGKEIYHRLCESFFNTKRNEITNVYDLHGVDDFERKDYLGLRIYTRTGNVSHNGKGVRMNVPLNYELTKREASAIKSQATFEDLFRLVHEMAHLIDGGYINTTKELLGEATSMGFEIALSDYLAKEKILPDELLKDFINVLMYSSYSDAKTVITILNLCDEKENNKTITLEFLETTCMKYSYPIGKLERDLQAILKDQTSLMWVKRYALGGMLAPTVALVLRQKSRGRTYNGVFRCM